MDHQLPILQNLRNLILSSAMNRQLTTINTRRHIITNIPVTVNLQTVRLRTQPGADEPVASQIIEQDILPALTIRVNHEPSGTLVSLNWKFQSINHEHLLI